MQSASRAKRGWSVAWNRLLAFNCIEYGAMRTLDRLTARTGSGPTMLDQHGIPELMRTVVTAGEFDAGTGQDRVGGERAKQFVVARARLVDAGQDRVDDPERGRRADSQRRHAVTRPHPTVVRRRTL